ncbi:MAG: endonuclease/exonuclease/phosphatase family protein [Hyphomonadaceae bacterium]
MRWILHGAIALGAAMLYALALAGWGGAISPTLDALNHFAPLLLAASGAGLMAAAFALPKGRMRIGALCLYGFAALTQAALIAPEISGQRSAMAEEAQAGLRGRGPSVRVVWLNTWSSRGDFAETLAYLERADADFLLVSELHVEPGRPIGRLNEIYPHFVRCTGRHDCNTAIFSKLAPVRVDDFALTEADRLRLTGAAYDVAGVPLRLYAAHLSRPLPADLQQASFARVAAAARAGGVDGAIVAGDFNSTPWSFALKRFDRESGLIRHTCATPTWPAQAFTRLRLPAIAPFMPIDHVYGGRSWRLSSIRRGPRTGSDHFPIEAEFAWVGAPAGGE